MWSVSYRRAVSDEMVLAYEGIALCHSEKPFVHQRMFCALQTPNHLERCLLSHNKLLTI